MAEHARRVEGRSEVWVDFEELNARGWAEVIEEAPCPPIAEGSGRVVTATITHANDDVRTLTLSSGEALFVTGNHRMFSATSNDWVPVKDLSIGEELQTSRGRESVAALGYQHGRHLVYNLEVEAEHCYFVGTGEVLTHNECITQNAKEGKEREAYVQEKLEGKFGEGNVQREQYLRTADGKIARDDGPGGTGEARRIDHVVIRNGKAEYCVETTSKTANKKDQIAKENRIRAAGGTFIRDRTTGKLVDVSGKKTRTRISRRR